MRGRGVEMHRKKIPNGKQIRFQIEQPEEMIYIRQEECQRFPGLRNLILMKFDPASGRQKRRNAAAIWTNAGTVSRYGVYVLFGLRGQP